MVWKPPSSFSLPYSSHKIPPAPCGNQLQSVAVYKTRPRLSAPWGAKRDIGPSSVHNPTSPSLLIQVVKARPKTMRRRSRLEENLANSGRSSTRQYLFYGTIGLLSLALPAALALFGHRFLPSNAPADSGATPYSVIAPTRSQDDTQRQPHPGPGLAVPADLRAGAVPPQVLWRGIASGIASRPESVHDIHVVFSTDCSPYQNYQSILLFQSAEVRMYWMCSHCFCYLSCCSILFHSIAQPVPGGTVSFLIFIQDELQEACSTAVWEDKVAGRLCRFEKLKRLEARCSVTQVANTGVATYCK